MSSISFPSIKKLTLIPFQYCSCKESDTHVFNGKYCEVKVEKLQLESTYIVAIAASVGGVIVIAAAVAIVCLVYRLRRRNTLNETDERSGLVITNLLKDLT
ncbi:hypothetical protein DPMN_185142 [Dreissena polymorpha]|uniref:Uncharacterized protein n=1 Tax=Dreissena polymorpha TaxID=45954 RepID=A0A9D4DLC3_DREPO|nr:hypothetical protein DPMN_185142 [Dreissena polymorpha]